MITTDDLTKKLNDAGIDTAEKLGVLAAKWADVLALHEADQKLDAVRAKEDAALAAIRDEKTEAANERAAAAAKVRV